MWFPSDCEARSRVYFWSPGCGNCTRNKLLLCQDVACSLWEVSHSSPNVHARIWSGDLELLAPRRHMRGESDYVYKVGYMIIFPFVLCRAASSVSISNNGSYSPDYRISLKVLMQIYLAILIAANQVSMLYLVMCCRCSLTTAGLEVKFLFVNCRIALRFGGLAIEFYDVADRQFVPVDYHRGFSCCWPT